MPKNNNIGFSNCTPDKQDGLNKFLKLHFRIVQAVLKNSKNKTYSAFPKYVYVDTNAGDGANQHYGEGSPVIFLRAAFQAKIPFKAYFIERESANVQSLQKIVKSFGAQSDVEIIEGDNKEILPKVVENIQIESRRKAVFGLVYKDPNGEPNLDLLNGVSRKLEKVDLLIRVPTRVLKRKANAPQCDASRLFDFIHKIKKEHWLIRDTFVFDRSHDWTFLFGANFKTGDWKKERFYSLDSEEGQRILERLNYTKKELLELKQMNMGWRDLVRERSGGICELCGENHATEMHHLRYGPEHDPAKLLHVCHACHCKLENKAI